MNQHNIPTDKLNKIINLALEEDLNQQGDITSKLICDENYLTRAELIAGEEGIMAGLFMAKLIWSEIDQNLEVDLKVKDGQNVRDGMVVAEVSGKARAILTGERTVLNFIQHLSGIATYTARYVEEVKEYNLKIFDTRKTTPGLRLLEKYAVRVGGGYNHRPGLFEDIFIKDVHISICGTFDEMLEKILSKKIPGQKIILEVEDIKNLEAAISAGADLIILDNMRPEQIIQSININQNRIELEASGGITLQNLREYAATGIKRISTGAITQSAPVLPVSLEIIK